MANFAQACKAYDLTRSFFRGGVKSDNKMYDQREYQHGQIKLLSEGANISIEQATRRVKTREANFNRSVQLQKDLDFTGRTPLQIGQERHGNGHTAGNCGIMAVVAMWLAYNDCWVGRDDMWLVTARNRQSLGPAELPAGGAGAPMQFEHSWAEIGTAADGGPFVIDPWAGVCCPEAQYAHDLTVQLNKWLQQGKQVRVNWGSLAKSYFYSIPANHPAILSLVAHNAVRDRVLGDEVIHARAAY